MMLLRQRQASFAYMDDEVIQQSRNTFRPDIEQSIAAAEKFDGKRLKTQYQGENAFTILPPTPEIPADTNLQNAFERLSNPKYQNVAKNKQFVGIHTHPLSLGKTDLTDALKPPSSLDLTASGVIQAHPANKQLERYKQYVYTKEGGKDVVYDYALPEDMRKRYASLNYKQLASSNPFTRIGEGIKVAPDNLKLSGYEYGAQLGSLADTAGYALKNVWTKPKQTLASLDEEFWKNRGRRLWDSYQRDKFPITRREVE